MRFVSPNLLLFRTWAWQSEGNYPVSTSCNKHRTSGDTQHHFQSTIHSVATLRTHEKQDVHACVNHTVLLWITLNFCVKELFILIIESLLYYSFLACTTRSRLARSLYSEDIQRGLPLGEFANELLNMCIDNNITDGYYLSALLLNPTYLTSTKFHEFNPYRTLNISLWCC